MRHRCRASRDVPRKAPDRIILTSPMLASSPTTPNMKNVGNYRCELLAIAQGEITNDDFTVGTIHGPTAVDSWVVWQDPAPGSKQPAGTAIELWTVDQPAPTCPMPPP